ncbi:MAG TPA: hypothetical protein VEK08_14610 [Planctomycetota bacterium]|nr:hypothetical protein [Planctomycetota bacterium]
MQTENSAPPAWRRYFAYLVVALMPISANIERLLSQKKPVYASPLDFLLPPLVLIVLVDLLLKKPWLKFKLPPVPTLLWASVAGISMLWIDGFPGQGTLKPALKDFAGVLLFGCIGVWAFLNVAADPVEARRLILILGASFSVCLLLALKQYVGPAGIPFDPDKPLQDLGGTTNMRLAGWYDFRAVFGSHVALLVPVAAAFAAWEKDPAVRYSAAVFGVLALCVTLAAGGFIGACAGVVAVAGACIATRRFIPATIILGGLVLTVALILPRLPRHNTEVLWRGVTLYADKDDKKTPTARLCRYQAALDLLNSPLDPQNGAGGRLWQRGVGIGSYQKNINRFYQSPYNKPGGRTDDEGSFDMDSDERFTFGFLETTAVELGVPGLLAVLLVFGGWILSAHSGFTHFASSENDDQRTRFAATIALAAFAAGTGALVLSIFASPMIPGVKGSFALFMALAYAVNRWAQEPKSQPTSGA